MRREEFKHLHVFDDDEIYSLGDKYPVVEKAEITFFHEGSIKRTLSFVIGINLSSADSLEGALLFSYDVFVEGEEEYSTNYRELSVEEIMSYQKL